MKYFILHFVLYISIIGIAQNTTSSKSIILEKKIIQLKNSDNLEETYYTFFDEYVATKQVQFLKKGLNAAWRNHKSNNEKIAKLHLIINLGYYYLTNSNIVEAIKYYEKGLAYYDEKKIKNYNIITYCLKPLANNYIRIGDFQRAEELLKYIILEAEKTNNNTLLIDTYINLSISYQSQSNYHKAISLLNKAQDIEGIHSSQKNKINTKIATNYYLLKQYNKALLLLNNSNANTYESKITKALCYFKLSKYIKSENLILNTINSAKAKISPRKLAKMHLVLGQIKIALNQLNEAKYSYNKSLNILITNYSQIKNNTNVLIKSLYAENTLIDSFEGLAKIALLKKELVKAIKYYQLAHTVSLKIQKNHLSQVAKIQLQQENKKRASQVIDLYYQLYKKSNNSTFIKDAFSYIEQNKAQVLLERLQENTYQSKFLKDSLLIKKEELEKRLAILDNQIKNEKIKNEKANIEFLQKLNQKVTTLNTRLYNNKQHIIAKYPFFKTINKPITIKIIQQKILLKEQLLVSYFDTKKYLYIFSISKNIPLTLRRIEKENDYKTKLQTFIDFFNNNQVDQIKEHITDYINTGYYLYKQLLATELKDHSYKYITIIPDSKLNFMAFDALLNKKTTYSQFEKLPYLVYDYQINYGYSATILAYQKNHKISQKTTNNTLGFFPYFENKHRGLSELKNTLIEKTAVSFGNSTTLFKEQATKKYFIENTHSYETIHLATHASAGTFDIPAHIEFRNNTLFLPEIYGLHLNTKLMVLSACETGIGKLQKGEGSMSLARGFLYAGVHNLIVSQWKVNDKSTSELMLNFYHNYYKTKNAPDALYKAKLTYLKSNVPNLNKSPYYWASFQFIGNLTKPDSFMYVLRNYFGIIVIVVFFISIFIKQYRKN